MRSTITSALLLSICLLIGAPTNGEPPAPDARLAPYSADPDHPWNRLHQALFVRTASDGAKHAHTKDPLLYTGGNKFLLDGEPHRRAVAALDEFLKADLPAEAPVKRLMFQHDLWAAFDYATWYPDEWVHYAKDEPAAVALRSRLAKAVGRLALSDRELAALPDNYALAVKAKTYPPAHDPARPKQPFLPADLFDPAGPWVRFHEDNARPMTQEHFNEVGGRSAHIVFLKLPGGRAATEEYLKELRRDRVKQFPPGTAVAMVRRALAVDASAKLRVTPVTELVQLRVYRRIPALAGPADRQLFQAMPGEQDVYEFVLDRPKLFAGQPGLRAVGPDELEDPFRRHDTDPFTKPAPKPADPDTGAAPPPPPGKQLQSCTGCHAGPGIYSVNSVQRGLNDLGTRFRTYAWDVEVKFTPRNKTMRYDWGMLQGKLEAK